MASDAKFFTRGKIQELRKELEDAESTKDKKFVKRKAALKRVVANITMGNDMSPLFPEMIRCMNVQVLEIKKMVYLFLVSYGRAKPEQTQHAIQHFLTDCNDRNPLIRGLAIRTMSYIPLAPVLSALRDPLRHSLKDQDPYVRKTAAICVAKLWMHDPRIVDKEGFITNLRDLLADTNPTVVANAVAALTEISDRSEEITLKLNITVASRLLAALGECSEWGQVYILESLMNFVPQTHQDADILAERISVRLQHANSAVVLTSIKVLLYLMNYMDSNRQKEVLCKKMGPPLITLLSSGPEVQYVALRNILLIIQRRPTVLKNDVKVFFCKYNDPVYVKLAKLEIMYRLANAENTKTVLPELAEYATELDIDFVRKAVRTIGRIAIKVPPSSSLCISTLLTLLETKITYVIQEVVVVIRDIFRRYPNQYESIIPQLCEQMDELGEPESKSAIIWIVGHYGERIENAVELLDDLAYNFLEEAVEVQLALLTACVKLFIQKSDSAKDLVSKILKQTTEEVDNPDLRDRGFMYWRLLSTNPGAAGSIVMADKPPISTETDRMDRGSLDQLLLHAGTLGSIYHKSPETFIRTARGKQLPDSAALNEASRAARIRLPSRAPGSSSAGAAPSMPEYRPTGGVSTADADGDMGAGDGAGDGEEGGEVEESLLGGGGGGGGDDGPASQSQTPTHSQSQSQMSEFSPSALSGPSAALGGPGSIPPTNYAQMPQALQVQDPYANLDGLFMSDAPQPMAMGAGGNRRGLGGEHDDLLF